MTRLGDEQVQALEWAYGVLSGLPTLATAVGVTLAALPGQVWTDLAPTGVTGTLVILEAREPQDRLALGDEPRIHSRVTLTVRTTTEGQDYTVLAPAARAIYDRLHGARNEAISEGGVILTCTRTGGVAFPELTEGVHYRHLGHTFRVEIN